MSERGYTLLEVLFVAGLMTAIAAIGTPQILATIDDYRALGAARYLSARLYATRMEALARSADAAMRFVQVGQSYAYAVYLDGNDNGVRARDIQSGRDRLIRAGETLPTHFPGVEFGAVAGVPAVDPPAPPPGNDPVRLGTGNMATFTALGTSTPGSLYIRNGRDTQYVIRIFGDTGKIRILKFNPRTGTWKPL